MSQSAYTCITCHVAFVNADAQRHHYKSDWHRYNLKRKVVGLPPVTVDDFQQRAATQKAIEKTNQSEKNIVGVSCKICHRTFSSFSTHKNHLVSKRHINAENKELQTLRKTLQEQSQAYIEKNICDDGREELEEQAIEKAITEARNFMKQPRIIKSDEVKSVKKSAHDNPRHRWFKKQVEEIEKLEEADENDEEWEELDDEELIGDEQVSEAESQTESACTETSSLHGVFSKIKLDSDADIESLASESNPSQKLLGPNNCLFCNEISTSAESNATHMSKKHSFFIPELAYLNDLEGLLTYLGEKVGVGNICLYCNEKGPPFYTLQAVRSHMTSKGHCKLYIEGDAVLEYADFYSFTFTDDEETSQSDEDTLSVVSLGSTIYQPDSTEEDVALVLPSGGVIGHRSLLRYYKQRRPTVDRFKSQRKAMIGRLLSQYKSVGWHGMSGGAVGKLYQRDIKFVQKMKSKYLLKLGSRNNKVMMKHLRPQVVF